MTSTVTRKLYSPNTCHVRIVVSTLITDAANAANVFFFFPLGRFCSTKEMIMIIINHLAAVLFNVGFRYVNYIGTILSYIIWVCNVFIYINWGGGLFGPNLFQIIIEIFYDGYYRESLCRELISCNNIARSDFF